MSDEFAKTIVLDQLPFANTPGARHRNPNQRIKPMPGDDDRGNDAGVDYPGFEDTSWLT